MDSDFNTLKRREGKDRREIGDCGWRRDAQPREQGPREGGRSPQHGAQTPASLVQPVRVCPLGRGQRLPC